MHPIISEMHARAIMEERHRDAARWRRVRPAATPSSRVRLGRLLVRAGHLLQRPMQLRPPAANRG